ncbi:MAG: hypothetical protein AAGU01_04520 [Clostridiaceae bacterium]
MSKKNINLNNVENSCEELSNDKIEIDKSSPDFDMNSSEILMGGDIDFSNAKVEKSFVFNGK